MELQEGLPFQIDAQRALERHWSVLVGGHGGGTSLEEARGVRSVVRESWSRSAGAAVRPDLESAPVVLGEDQLRVAAEGSDWLDVAMRAVGRHQRSFGGVGHILSLFDHEARMLSCEGDPAAVEGLAEINFRPGGLWAETVVGTNGPGTALATGAPAHIVGAEHFCERWQRWHCAAVPIRDPATDRIAGVLDISGFREFAHPHTLNLALALVVAIEQTLVAREVERRFLTLQSLSDLRHRYPGDAVLAVDRAGRIVGSAPSLSPALAASVSAMIREASHDLSRETAVPVMIGQRHPALWFPVVQGRTVIGGCLVLEGGAPQSGSEGIPFRPGDVRVYARRFFEAGARDLGRLELSVEPAVYDALQAYHWPGNVRELKNVIRRVLHVTGRQVRVSDLPQSIREAYAGGSDSASSAIDREDALLARVVQESRTMAEAAARLGITRSTLYRRMERFGLKPKRVLGRE
ncbi:MAG TPA: GAF domain-containing protein [Gemmatimonadales bacterium]|nr:GAF domain-containing protein [Gemmatimonadales bacterium]